MQERLHHRTVRTSNSAFQQIYTVAFLGVVAAVQMMDRGIISTLSPFIQSTFQVGDSAIGGMHGIAGILIASILALPLSHLIDRRSRKAVLSVVILLWVVMTVAGATAPTFAILFISRISAGVTEFALVPLVYSLIPDVVSKDGRAIANLTFACLVATGASAGFYAAGDLLEFASQLSAQYLNHAIEPWRATLLLLAFMGLPLIFGVAPMIDMRETRKQNHKSTTKTAITFLKLNRAQVSLFLGAVGALALAGQAVTSMIAPALHRQFGTPVDDIGRAMGLITLVTSFISLLIAGMLDYWLKRRLSERSRPVIILFAAALAAPPMLFLSKIHGAQTAFVLIGIFLVANCVANAIVPTMLQDLTPARIRGRCFAAYTVVISICLGVGPFVAGMVSDHLTNQNLIKAISLTAVPVLALSMACSVKLLKMQKERSRQRTPEFKHDDSAAKTSAQAITGKQEDTRKCFQTNFL